MPRIVQFFILISISIWITSGCNRQDKRFESLQKFNAESWKNDKSGCKGERLVLKNELLAIKHKMRGFKTDEIESFLGNPDAQELYNRSQRYYIYFIEPGPKCAEPIENPQALFVRFSAVGIANEFVVKPL